MSNLSDTQMDELCSFAGRLADTARKIITPYFRSGLSIDDKPTDSDTGQPVTRADRESEEAMRDLITSHYPDHG
ncbi:MAG TPA: histidinol-phosphatase, partial [Alphaproteobacteria bacterium]|nr:histidinol-phosphatase [Alphaproteobacteria bacterium]